MTQQEIKSKMTKGEWVVDNVDDIINNGDGLPNPSIEFSRNIVANGYAICSAINNTYGKGINPEKVEILYKALEASCIFLEMTDYPNSANAIEQLLTEAKL